MIRGVVICDTLFIRRQAMKPRHLCNYPSCNELIPYDQSYCSKHEYKKPIDRTNKQQRHQLNKAIYHKRITSKHEGKYQRFYRSTAWKKLSHHWLMMHPLCVNCEAHRIYRKGDLVDHIIELRDDWSKRLDQDNLQTLCYACHNRKTRQAKHRRQQHERQME